MDIKRLILFLSIVLMSLTVLSQKHGDIAIFGGGSYYLGEINHVEQFKASKPAYGAFYRHLFDYRYSLRGSLYYGTLSGTDKESPWDYNVIRAHEFEVNILDAAAMLEFNFLPYYPTSKKRRYAPYVTAGLGYMIPLSSDAPGTMTIPFGIGFKFSFAERFSAGFEWAIRKTFSDETDGLGDWEANPYEAQWLDDESAEAFRQQSLIYRNDFHVFTGVFLSYKFNYKKVECPAYGEKNFYE